MSARPDIVFTIGYLGRFSSNPSEQHLKAAKRILAYLKGTLDKVSTLGQLSKDNGVFTEYCDADYAKDLETRCNTTGYCFKLLDSVISWSSIRQNTVATPTCEAEPLALAKAVKETTWLSRMLKGLNFIKRTCLSNSTGTIKEHWH
jgi:hypothetical protein